MEDLLELDITVDPGNYIHTALKVLGIVKPKWDVKEKIRIEINTKGYLNKLFLCRYDDDPNADHADDIIIIRVWGDQRDLNFLFNRDSEMEIMRILQHEKIIARLYCKFNNGYVHKYIEGEILERKQFYDDHILKGIAHQLHRLHSIEISKYEDVSSRRNNMKQGMEKMWQYVLDNVDDENKGMKILMADIPGIEELQKEVDKVYSIYDQLHKRHKIVCCHLDAHKRNIVYDCDTGNLQLIDWEGVAWEAEIFDVCITMDRDHEGIFVGPACRRQWLHAYLSTHPKHKQNVTDELVESWYSDLIHAGLFQYLNHTIASIAFCANSEKKEALTPFINIFYKEYTDLQKEVTAYMEENKY